jgi:hypothetical protein
LFCQAASDLGAQKSAALGLVYTAEYDLLCAGVVVTVRGRQEQVLHHAEDLFTSECIGIRKRELAIPPAAMDWQILRDRRNAEEFPILL